MSLKGSRFKALKVHEGYAADKSESYFLSFGKFESKCCKITPTIFAMPAYWSDKGSNSPDRIVYLQMTFRALLIHLSDDGNNTHL
jgi:hypothetical protein